MLQISYKRYCKNSYKRIGWHIPHFTPSSEIQQIVMDQLLNNDQLNCITWNGLFLKKMKTLIIIGPLNWRMLISLLLLL